MLLPKFTKKGVILVTCHSVHEAEQLYKAGATYVILPHYLGAYHATEMIAQFEKHPRIFVKARKIQKEQMARHH
jgi:D-serine deaminase-like pyridoxal phosphate-dependent protein